MLLILLTGCNGLEQNDEPALEEPESSEPEQTVEDEAPEKIASNLEIPWSINNTGQEFYISERTGSIVHIDTDGSFNRHAVMFSSPLSSAAEAGLLGFVLKQDFNSTNEAYAYYVYENQWQSFNVIVIISLENGSWNEKDILLNRIPTGNVHHGGRLALDENGVLFATVGDASNPDLAQDPDFINGKILRLSESGELEIYSSGHRNPQGLAWADDQMYASEHGQSLNDEINIIQEDNNYGWPIIEGDDEREGLATPFYTTGNSETWASSGLAVHNGNLYIASLRGSAIQVLDLQNGEIVDTIEGFGRIRDVYIEGDELYFITNNTDGRGNPSEDDDTLFKMTIGQQM